MRKPAKPGIRETGSPVAPSATAGPALAGVGASGAPRPHLYALASPQPAPRAIGEAPPDTPWDTRPGKTLKARRSRRVRTLRPGAPGTKRLVAQYGDRLVCVRYVYDAGEGKRLKTVELIVEEASWSPERAKIAPAQLVGLRIGYDELALRESVKAAGGKWDRVLQVWVLPYQEVLALRLAHRVSHTSSTAVPQLAPNAAPHRKPR